MKIIGYRINISKEEYQIYKSYIDQNKSLSPEIIGIFLGRAKPFYLVDKQEKIKKEELYG